MTRVLVKSESRTAGLPPGTLVHVGVLRAEKMTLSVIDYNESKLEEPAVATPDECRKYLSPDTVTWINLTGLQDTQAIAKLGEVYGLHPLVLEDIVNTGQRPKMEDLGDHLFLVLKMIYRSPKTGEIVAEQVSFIVGPSHVISFQEVEGDVFDVIRERLRAAKGRIRKMGADYLAYALLDAIVDNYYVVLEEIGERTEALQELVVSQPEPETLRAIHALRSDMIFLRKNLWPVRELVGSLDKSESRLITKALRPYLRDVYEHTVQVIDTIETMRDMVAGALDMYVSSVSNRLNEVMRVLTVIATIFIPLTFIVGVYGMNFEHMPELSWPLGYALVWVVIVLVALGMLAFFRRRKWL